MDQSKLLSGKTAVVTGATSGIGLAAALMLAQHGANVIGVGRNAQRCQKAESEIRAAWPEAKIHFLLADLSSPIRGAVTGRQYRRGTSPPKHPLPGHSGKQCRYLFTK